MAKRKLSLEQRQRLRQDISAQAKARKSVGDIVRSIAAKYKISTVTVRWYLRTGNHPAKGTEMEKASPVKQSTKAKQKGRRAFGNGSLGKPVIATSSIVERVRQATEKGLRKAREAQRLIPKWEVFVNRESKIIRQVGKLNRELHLVSLRARALQKKITTLAPH